MKEHVEKILKETVNALSSSGTIPNLDQVAYAVSIPQNRSFGDYATNIAMVAAKQVKRSPREVAGIIVENLSARTDFFEKVEIAGPGFINCFVQPAVWVAATKEVLAAKERFGRTGFGQGKPVQVEFVSANPTGPLHVGHGRGAAVGDTLARILDATGFQVQREYYINDTGNQMNMLGLSVLRRYQEIHGQAAAFPENGYQGDYIRDLALQMQATHADGLLKLSEEEAIALCREFAGGSILEGIREDLNEFAVGFDHWFNESRLYQEGKLDKALALLKEKGLIYESEGALWFSSSKFGDEKDRVIRKQDGALTYFAPDIAYHLDKLERGFTRVIDIWGADHHGYVARMRAALEAMDAPDDCFHALLIQLVSLVRSGEPVQMSTRSGEFITLKEVLDEVGKDAARYFFLMRRCDSHLVFDLDLAKKKGEENPVYYIQYAHARICSILRKAATLGLLPDIATADLDPLRQGDDLELIKNLAVYPDLLISCAADLEPHRLSFYLLDLASAFHKFYNKNKVISEDEKTTHARLLLIDALRQVIANGLSLMGIDAPETM